MGSDNSPEQSPNRLSKPRRLLSKTKTNINQETEVQQKPPKIKNFSKLSRILTRPKNIMSFIAQTENIILLKNMNDSLSIGLNHLNILIENDLNNPFLENQLKYLQIIHDSIDKKILGKLNIQDYNQKQIESLINNLIEINNNYSNNINIGNISSIHKRNGKYGSREDSPTSREDELDLTSFSTTIGGKISSASNYNNNNNNNNKNQNSKQVRTFKIRKKDGFFLEGNYNSGNNNNHKKSSSRHDSQNSTNSINSSNNISNVLSSINATNTQSKNSSNNSTKDKNINIKNSNNNRNNSPNNNKNIIIKDNNACNRFTVNNNINNSNQTKAINKTNRVINNNNINYNNKVISKKIIKKK